jgi:hypothetical protein
LPLAELFNDNNKVMFTRFKVLLSLSILAVLGILLGQNRELLALKFLCADLTKSCFYQTPALPLALWMGLFILAGIITSLVWQILNRAAYPSVKPAKTYEDPELSRSSNNNLRGNRTPNWEANSEREPWDDIATPPTPNSQNGISSSTPVDTAVYERQREPQQVQRSGSTYSYKFKEANSDPVDSTSPDDAPRETKSKDDDEDWI